MPIVSDYWVQYAIAEIEATYGDVVSVDKKKKSLLKFGENVAVGTSETSIMPLTGTETKETYATSNSIDRIVIDDTFTGTMQIEGHTISGSVSV